MLQKKVEPQSIENCKDAQSARNIFEFLFFRNVKIFHKSVLICGVIDTSSVLWKFIKAAFIYIYEHLADWFEILPLRRWFEGFCLSSSFYEIFNELNCSQNNPVFLQFVIQDWRRLVL